MKLIGKVTSFDKIVAFLKDELAETELTEKEQEMLIRWNEAFTIQRRYNSTADTAAILMKRFPGLSRATAYRDCANAISMFGDISKASREGIRHLSTEIIKDASIMARSANDYDSMIKAGVAIAKVNGVNLVEPETFDWAEVEPHTYELSLDDNMIKALRSLIKGGKIDLTMVVEAMSNQAEDIPFEELRKELPGANN